MLLTFSVQGPDGQFVTVPNVHSTNGATEEYPIPVHVVPGKECIKNFHKILRYITLKMYSNCQIFIVAHYGNIFDHLYLIDNLPVNIPEWKEKEKIIGSSKLKNLVWQTKNGNVIYLKDTGEYAPGSLEGHARKWPCGSKLDFDREHFEADLTAESIFYCQRDTAIVAYMCKEKLPDWFSSGQDIIFADKYGFFLFYSQAHIAYNMMLAMSTETYFQIQKEFYLYGKESYYGARCESCIYGKEARGQFGGYDISSLYPSGMNNPMPTGQFWYQYNQPTSIELTSDIDKIWKQKPFICTVTLEKSIPDTLLEKSYGILPVRLNGNLVYTTDGKVTGVYTCIDICAAIQDGWQVVEAKKFLVWPKWTTAPAEFYQHWFKIKQSSKNIPAKYWFSKIVLNSSIGKFCQKIFDPKNDNTKPSYLGWFCLAYTRIAHRKIKEMLLAIGCDRVYYGDTDSIFVDRHYITKLEYWYPDIFNSKMLGTAKQITGEKESDFDTIIVLGKKSYCMISDGKLVKTGSKGVNKKFATISMYRQCLRDRQVPVTMNRPTRYLKQLACGNYISGVTAFKTGTKIQQITVPKYHIQFEKYTIVQTLYVTEK